VRRYKCVTEGGTSFLLARLHQYEILDYRENRCGIYVSCNQVDCVSCYIHIFVTWAYSEKVAKFRFISLNIYFFLISWGAVRLSPLGTSAFNWPVVPSPNDRWWWVWSRRWNENWGGNRSTRPQPAPASLLLPQIPHDGTLDRTRAAVWGRRLTAWAMVRS
jgi:hypothetical protein